MVGGVRGTGGSTVLRRARGALAVVSAACLLVAVVLVLGGRSAAAAADPAQIVGHVYRAVSVERDGRPHPSFERAEVWVVLDRRSLAVHGGCNAMVSDARVSGSRIELVDGTAQTAMGCPPAFEERDAQLGRFFGSDPSWLLTGDRLVLTAGATTMTLVRDDLPPALPHANAGRKQALISGRFGVGEFRTWPWRLGESWYGPFVKLDVEARGRRTFLVMRARCRRLEAPITVGRTTLRVAAPRSVRSPCRSVGTDSSLRSVRPFFGGTVAWHLDDRRLTLQRDRARISFLVR